MNIKETNNAQRKETFRQIVESAANAVEDFNDMPDDRAIIWAQGEIDRLTAALAASKEEVSKLHGRLDMQMEYSRCVDNRVAEEINRAESAESDNAKLKEEVNEAGKMIVDMMTSMANVQNGSREMVKFSDQRALEYKHAMEAAEQKLAEAEKANTVLITEMYAPNGTAAIADWKALEAQLTTQTEKLAEAERSVDRLSAKADAALREGETLRRERDTQTAIAERYREDAERWQAVIGCARVRVLGSAGLDPNSTYYREGYAHIGVELWTQHPAPREEWARQELTKFADVARALAHGPTGKESLQVQGEETR